MKTGRLLCLLALAAVAGGCASSQPGAITEFSAAGGTPVGHLALGNQNDQRLAALWASRYGKRSEFPIGSGDVLEVSVPGIDELKERTARVDEDGNVSLPLLGSIHAGGFSEDGVRKEMLARLSKYMYHPQVDLFVKSFSSRQAGVLGEVRNPAMYTLNGPADTVREMLQRAGGITDNAAQEILLTPAAAASTSAAYAETSAHGSIRDVALPASAIDMRDGSPGHDGEAQVKSDALDAISLQGTLRPVVITLSSTAHERYLDLPVVPGDTLYVPRAGEVTVVGWVYAPKVLPITPGLTVLGAVSAAGGTLYAGDATSIRIIRQGRNGQILTLDANLDKIKKREMPDVPVQANDIVEVSYSALRIPGYALYYAAQSIFGWAPAAMIMTGVP